MTKTKNITAARTIVCDLAWIAVFSIGWYYVNLWLGDALRSDITAGFFDVLNMLFTPIIIVLSLSCVAVLSLKKQEHMSLKTLSVVMLSALTVNIAVILVCENLCMYAWDCFLQMLFAFIVYFVSRLKVFRMAAE